MIKKNINEYMIVITPTVNNLFVSINSTKGHLFRSFSFAHVHITACDHRKRKIFSQEFGSYFGKYLNKLNLTANFNVKIKGSDPRVFSFLEYFIKAGGHFNKIEFKSLSAFNGCRASKRKRL